MAGVRCINLTSHFTTLFLLTVTLVGYLIGLLGEAWWVHDVTGDDVIDVDVTTARDVQGLLRYCNGSRGEGGGGGGGGCRFREDIFEFFPLPGGGGEFSTVNSLIFLLIKLL